MVVERTSFSLGGGGWGGNASSYLQFGGILCLKLSVSMTLILCAEIALTSQVVWGSGQCLLHALKGFALLHDRTISSFGPPDRTKKISLESIPKSIAQIPVPVPISKTLWSSPVGARIKLLSKVMRNSWCWRSSLSCSVWIRSADILPQTTLEASTCLIIWEEIPLTPPLSSAIMHWVLPTGLGSKGFLQTTHGPLYTDDTVSRSPPRTHTHLTEPKCLSSCLALVRYFPFANPTLHARSRNRFRAAGAIFYGIMGQAHIISISSIALSASFESTSSSSAGRTSTPGSSSMATDNASKPPCPAWIFFGGGGGRKAIVTSRGSVQVALSPPSILAADSSYFGCAGDASASAFASVPLSLFVTAAAAATTCPHVSSWPPLMVLFTQTRSFLDYNYSSRSVGFATTKQTKRRYRDSG